jgi:aconitase B
MWLVLHCNTKKLEKDKRGKNAKVYLGSAELSPVVSTLGRILSNEEYFSKLDGIV